MLVQYTVENYKSIRDELTINFRADEKYRDSDWTIKAVDTQLSLYKCMGLIGPNASGKTNIIQSFYFAFRFILNTIMRKDSAGINVETFSYGESESQAPTSFEFVFYQNRTKYVYGFSVNRQEVVEEYLGSYFQEEIRLLFERNVGQQYTFADGDRKIQEEIVQKTNPNRLYMPVAAEWGYAPLKEVYQWFEFYARPYNFKVSSIIGKLIEEGKKDIFINELQKADFNIKNIYIKNKKVDQKSHYLIEHLLTEYIGRNEEVVAPSINPEIRVVHENGAGKLLDIDLEEDSAGTEKFVADIAEFFYLSAKGGLVVEDELGKDYHTRLTQHFLSMFQSPAMNPGNTQLFFTTHNTKILNMVNPDQVYLVDKDETGATVVKLLDDFEINAEDDIELGYLKGRYGSVPYMRG